MHPSIHSHTHTHTHTPLLSFYQQHALTFSAMMSKGAAPPLAALSGHTSSISKQTQASMTKRDGERRESERQSNPNNKQANKSKCDQKRQDFAFSVAEMARGFAHSLLSGFLKGNTFLFVVSYLIRKRKLTGCAGGDHDERGEMEQAFVLAVVLLLLLGPVASAEQGAKLPNSANYTKTIVNCKSQQDGVTCKIVGSDRDGEWTAFASHNLGAYNNTGFAKLLVESSPIEDDTVAAYGAGSCSHVCTHVCVCV